MIFQIIQIDANSGLYLVSTQSNLGYSEKQICELTSEYIDKIIKCEIEQSKHLSSDQDEVLDKCMRAKAIINSCIKISADELYELIGNILIAINGGVEHEITNDNINQLLNCINVPDANNQKKLAKIIKNILK